MKNDLDWKALFANELRLLAKHGRTPEIRQNAEREIERRRAERAAEQQEEREVGAVGFEPTISCSQSKRVDQATPRPDNL